MDSAEVYNRFDKIVDGRLRGREGWEKGGVEDGDRPKEDASGANSGIKNDGVDDELNDDQVTNWIPQVKRLVEFPDMRMNTQVLPIEDFSSKRKRKTAREIDRRWREHAIIVRRILNSKFGLLEYRLEIRSVSLRDIFKRIAKPYKEINLDASPIEIPHPFLCLFHLRDQLKELQASEETPAATRQELEHLLAFISTEPVLRTTIEPYDELVSKNKISRDLPWTLFRSHEWVYIKGNDTGSTDYVNEECVFSISVEEPFLNTTNDHTHFLRCVSTVYNGTKFGVAEKRVPFGSRSKEIVDISIKDLKIVPMRFLSDQQQQEIRHRLIARGKDYCALSMASHKFMEYNGPVVLRPENNAQFLVEITGDKGSWNKNLATSQRVMIDRKAEREIGGLNFVSELLAPCLKEYLGYSRRDADAGDGDVDVNTVQPLDQDKPLGYISDSDSEGDFDADQIVQMHSEKRREQNMIWDGQKLANEDYLMCTSTLIAFLLREKVWAFEIHVHGLKEIVRKQDPFISLQLPEDKKRLVKHLVQDFGAETSVAGSITYEDIIEGKGRGLVFLLHGPPGLGKTLTAESVAESTHRPLYHVSTGELSANVKELEGQLTQIFRLGLRWGAVVLLDEADVLDQEVNHGTGEECHFFLRLIEYYDGMLFLTTNRFDDFDNAFYNRIHVSIRYRPLQSPERTNIWRQHLTRASRRSDGGDGSGSGGSPRWSEEAYRLLGQIETNGRDIRNYTRTAYGYARALGEDLGIRHVVSVIRNNIDVDESSDAAGILQDLEALEERTGGRPHAEVSEHPVGGRPAGRRLILGSPSLLPA
ncbi:AAA family ATPase [Colletotrichum musicola]|uniref:AAA family ATPase n=1 Tax=Colletotrichum musicola TaxID=2175873 RepID=A0A8H6KPP8_9PEZI|nr:AAA family ATPase [Colletotrichum musicola]